MLITDIGADPSVIEKCTVGGLDTAMGASGSQFSNIKAANTQHHLLAIRDRDGGRLWRYVRDGELHQQPLHRRLSQDL